MKSEVKKEIKLEKIHARNMGNDMERYKRNLL
jgi:hypothetical protein